MALLIDPANFAARDRWWCHLVSDASFAELHAFAHSAGIPERAFHRDHYDIPADQRDAIVAAGAEQVSSRELVRRITAAGLRRPKHLQPE